MSDYGDGDYDDFEDELHELLYDADPNPDLADELAEHTMHSPLWQENPSEELRDYFSDWEYYSDDYFDDDPGLMNTSDLPQTAQKRKNRVEHISNSRKRKRKISDEGDAKLKWHETVALRSCLRGTVWKVHSPDRTVVFGFGSGDSVALRLSDEAMKATFNKDDHSGERLLKRDESWANDLSLADMGLKPERSLSMHQQEQDTALDAEDEDYEEEAIQDEVADDEDDVDMHEEAALAETVLEDLQQVDFQCELDALSTTVVQEETQDHRKGRKRRKMSRVERADEDVPTPDASLQSDLKEEGQEKQQAMTVQGTKGTGRKRKLSVSSATASTASSRAKRVAISQTAPDDTGIVKTAAASRPSRTHKKVL